MLSKFYIIKRVKQHRGQIFIGIMVAIMVLISAVAPLQMSPSSVTIHNIEEGDHDKNDQHDAETFIKSPEIAYQTTSNDASGHENLQPAAPSPGLDHLKIEQYIAPFCTSVKAYFKTLFSRIISRNAP